MAHVLDEALRYVISGDAFVEKDASTDRYLLLQIADFVCGLELERIKFENHEETATDRLFFVTGSNLKRAYLKKFNKNRIER